MGIFASIVEKLKGLVDKAKALWSGLNTEQQTAAVMGAGGFVVAAAIGGVVLQAAFIAVVFNFAMFRLMHDSPKIKEFISKHNVKLDLTLSILSFIFSPLPGVGGAITAIMTGVYFSVFRVVHCPVIVKPDAPVKEAEVPNG